MVCENAGRWARIHDIYIFAILKSFLGNRIEYEIIIPVPRAVCPCSSPVSPLSPLAVSACRWGGTIASTIKQPIVLSIVVSLPCRLPCRASCRCSRPVISSAHLSRRVRPSHPMPSISLFACPRRLPSSRLSPRRIDKQGGALSPYAVSPFPFPPSRLVRYRGT